MYSMKNNADRRKRQLAILSEFCAAQKNGFVLNIEIDLAEKHGKIIYEQKWEMYRNNEHEEPIPVTESDDLKDVPNFNKLYVTFSERVLKKSLEKICDYAAKQYDCKFTLADHKITFFEF